MSSLYIISNKYRFFSELLEGILVFFGYYNTFISYKEPTCECRRHNRSLGREDPLKKEMATHSSILTWKFSWTKEPGGLQSMELQRVGHD